MPSGPILSFAVLIVLAWAAIIVVYRDRLLRLWLEPALRQPVLIVESDDWGPGPETHADALERLCAVLARHTDCTGRHAVMTVGAILAVPDNAAIRASAFGTYSRRTLLDPEFDPVRNALVAGRNRGVLTLQLHGLEHLWPPAFMHAAASNGEVRTWIEAGEGTDTESLPSHVQSRWADTSVLPSRAQAESEIAAAVTEEVSLFRDCFGTPPAVVVPPTFVWNRTVEAAWARHGVTALVTPGRRLTGRDAAGKPAMADRSILNGDRAEGGMTCVVRDIYFEPAYGHTAEQALRDSFAHFRLGRPALLETHRFNFTGDAATADASLRELDLMLARALETQPRLRFLTVDELAERLASRDSVWVHDDLPGRVAIWLRRLARIGRLRKLAFVSGLIFPAALLYLVMHAAARGFEPTPSGIPA